MISGRLFLLHPSYNLKESKAMKLQSAFPYQSFFHKNVKGLPNRISAGTKQFVCLMSAYGTFHTAPKLKKCVNGAKVQPRINTAELLCV